MSNMYCYCNNSVPNLSDHSGMVAMEISIAAGVVVGLCLILVALLWWMSQDEFNKAWTEFCVSVGNGLFGISNTITNGGYGAYEWSYETIISVTSAVVAFMVIAQKYAEIKEVKNKIPNKLKTKDGRIDLNKFDNPNGPKGPKGGRGILGPLGWYLLKDLDHHKGSFWKLFNYAGQRIASIAKGGTIVGK